MKGDIRGWAIEIGDFMLDTHAYWCAETASFVRRGRDATIFPTRGDANEARRR